MERMELFIGPCMLETHELVLEVAAEVNRLNEILGDKVDIYFKGSFDKANRSSINSKRGPGLEKGISWLKEVKQKYGLKTITDYHLPEQAEQIAKEVDVLQVPAFLCRQTDVIVAGALACKKYGRILKVKKGQFLSPEETKNIVDKAGSIIPLDQIRLTERGTSFGYNNLVVDMASFSIMKSFGVKAIHDATHCLQRPGGLGTQTGGKREQLQVLAKAAIAAGADGIFMEVHPNPKLAYSDSATALPLDQAEVIIKELLKIYEVING